VSSFDHPPPSNSARAAREKPLTCLDALLRQGVQAVVTGGGLQLVGMKLRGDVNI